jgi:hypothetical protein
MIIFEKKGNFEPEEVLLRLHVVEVRGVADVAGVPQQLSFVQPEVSFRQQFQISLPV